MLLGDNKTTHLTNLIFLLACLVIGFLLGRIPALRQREAHLVINTILLYVCLPAATVLYTSSTVFERQYALPILMPWLLFGGSFLFFRILRKPLKLHPHTEAVLILTAGIPSVSFVGFPIFELLYGPEGMHIGVLMSQAGSFLVCSTLGVLLASYYARAATRKSAGSEIETANGSRHLNPAFLLDVLRFPTFIAFVIALIINLLGWKIPALGVELLQKLAAPFSFLALVSVGMQIDFRAKDLNWKILGWGLGYKLIVAPLLVFLVFGLALQQKGIIGQMSILGAALGPMNTVAIIASNYGLNPKLAAQMVGIGIPLSLLTIAVGYGICHFLGYI